jgi:predicted Zn finger-like uncharacterized protein
MIIVCPSCQARYKFDESKLGDRPRAKTRCSKCGGSIEIQNPHAGVFTLPPGFLPTPSEGAAEARPLAGAEGGGGEPAKDGTVTGKDLHKLGLLELPKDKRFSVAIIQGEGTGQIFQIGKSRTLIGRVGAEADIHLDDVECSRQHAVIEILGETVILRDLDSTNGTFIELDQIQQQLLTNQMEFRIGSHVLMFIVTDVE